MKILKHKGGNILAENLVSIILNLVFLAILILFLFSKMGAAAVLEERYAKEIALLIDSAEPGMTIHITMADALKEAGKAKWPADKVVLIEGNEVKVQLREKGGYSYSFFNDVKVDAHVDEQKGEYFFVISKK